MSTHESAPFTLLGVWAHPDDEAYLSAGLMARVIDAGGRVVCVHATAGEAGTTDPGLWPPERLGRLRRRELVASLAELGVTDIAWLGYRDGACAEADPAEATSTIAGHIRRVRPDLIVTFGPDGVTGHPDHIAVSRWTTAAWNDVGRGTLLYATSTRSFLDEFAEVHQRLGLFGPDAPFVVDEDVALAVSLDEAELDRKRRALAAHASQTAPLARAMSEAVYRRWYATEAFRTPAAVEVAAASPTSV